MELALVLMLAVIAGVIGVVSYVKKDKLKKTNAPPDRQPTPAERMIDEAQFVFEPVDERRSRSAAPLSKPPKIAPHKPMLKLKRVLIIPILLIVTTKTFLLA